MVPTFVSFYMLAAAMILAALGIILVPRMFLALISFVVLIFASSFVLFQLNSSYVAVFQLILCGIFVSGSIFILLKKIGRLNLKNRLVPIYKILSGAITAGIFGMLVLAFFKEDFSNSLYEIFNFTNEKSTSVLDFSLYAFPLHLVLLLIFVCVLVIRVFLLSAQNSALSSEGNTVDMQNEDDEEDNL